MSMECKVEVRQGRTITLVKRINEAKTNSRIFVVLIYSVCEKTQEAKNLKTVEDELMRTNSLIKNIDK
jgi:hypothetical protein